ncbi:MAG TPA: DUF885 domain-containing protein [Steroidobacteraceae bacterium]|nr:DUF885 domain-containing protein [Steroidobacteraceae bacterium]
MNTVRNASWILLASFALAGCGTRDQSASTDTAVAVPESGNLNKLVDSYFEKILELNPTLATSIGDGRYNDRLSNDISEQWLADSLAVERDYLARLREIEPDSLDDASRLTYDVFKDGRELSIAGAVFQSELLPISQFQSTAALFAQMGSGSSIHPFATTADYDAFLKRVDGFVVWADQAIANMKAGVQVGIVQPRIVVEKSLPQMTSFVVDDPKKSLFYKPVENFPKEISDADRKRLTDAYTVAIRDKVTPAYKRLHDYMKNDYLSHARTSVGMSALPQGDKWYAYLARVSTTTTLTPEQIHDIGLKEMARIQTEMERVKTTTGFKGTLKEYIAQLRVDPQFQFKKPEELIAGYNALRERVETALPKLFDTMPKMTFEVRPVEPFREASAATGSYMPGTPDGQRPGVFYANTYALPSRPSFMMEAIFLHEALPGHHMQIALQYEMPDVPRFRRFGGDTAYMEGWGLYSESLGKELGMYQDPYQYFGSLTAEAWRAARLVVDTGMHAKGWTREQAIIYMRDNTAIGESDVVAEVERYIAIPGQALAYKIGQLKLRELRTRAEKALGGKFNVRDFHTQILKDGSLPLDVLDAKINRWIQAKK